VVQQQLSTHILKGSQCTCTVLCVHLHWVMCIWCAPYRHRLSSILIGKHVAAYKAFILTSWQYFTSLALQIDKAPELIRPSNCAKTGPALSLANPTIEPSVNSWIPACDQAKRDCITNATHEQPYLNCTYKSMSTFWEIQQWIRNHGAVVTRYAFS
jgi:hypothetical protein